MQVDILKLEKENIGKFLSEALNDSRTGMLIEELKKEHTVHEFSVTKGVNLKLKYADQDDVSLDTLFMYFNNEAVIEVSKQANSENIKKIVAHFTAEKDNGKIINRLDVSEGVLKLMEINYKESYFDFLGESDAIEENEVNSQAAWYEGCLIFGDPSTSKYYYYRHCGAKCGDGGSVGGGGTPINSLDSCCRAHDRCWANFGKDNCDCDKELGRCAERTSDPGWYMVATWAYEKKCN